MLYPLAKSPNYLPRAAMTTSPLSSGERTLELRGKDDHDNLEYTDRLERTYSSVSHKLGNNITIENDNTFEIESDHRRATIISDDSQPNVKSGSIR